MKDGLFIITSKIVKVKKIFLLFFLPSLLIGQAVKDSLLYSQNYFYTKSLNNNFDKQLNTYNFYSSLSQYYKTEKFFLGVKGNLNSTIIKTAEKNIRDEQFISAIGLFNLSQLLKIGIFTSNNFYSDDRKIAISNASVLNSSFFLKAYPIQNVEITPFLGFSINNQINERDNGYLYGTELNINKFSLIDFEISSIMRYQNEDISPRKNTTRFINLSFNSGSDNNFENSITAFLNHQRKDFYFTADATTQTEFDIVNNIQSRTETNYFIQDKLRYAPVNSALSIEAQGRISWRDIERNTRYVSLKNISSTTFDSKIQEFRLDFSTNAKYQIRNMNLIFNINFAEREEKHQPRKIEGISGIIYSEREIIESQKNNISQLATISLSSFINLSEKDNLLFSLFHRKLKYDTPSNINHDDRDELLSIGRILYERKLNSFFTAFINLEASINKIVYIFSQRSSNNNTKRIIKLSSGGKFISKNFISSNSAEVLANYTVFDYEELNPNFRSYSFRQLIVRDSSTYSFTKNLKFFITGYIKNSEQGNFNWSNFTSKPQRFLKEYFTEPKFLYDYNNFTFGIGMRYFSLSTYNIINGTEKVKFSDYSSIGPVSEIIYNFTDNLSFRTYGWYEFIKTENNSKREMANFYLKLTYNFL